jgi:hypothetical protein
MKKTPTRLIFAISVLVAATGLFAYKNTSKSAQKNKINISEKLKLPLGFSATVLATDLGSTRHIAISKNGDIYAKLSKLKDGKGICMLRDTNNDGVID